jgi:hypothetical protein
METTIGRQRVFLLVALGCIPFVVLIALAMIFYPGGTTVDVTTESYSFFGNFLGDLGRRPLSLSGHLNLISPWLFAAALIAAAAALTIFFIALPRLLGTRGGNSILAWVGSMAGVAAGLCLVGVAVTPVNKFWVLHNQFATWAVEEFTVACVCYLLVTLFAPHYPKRHALAFFLFVVVAMGYLAIYVLGPQLDTPSGQMIGAITQKIVVLAAVVTIAFESWSAYRVAAHPRVLPDASESLTLSSAPSV